MKNVLLLLILIIIVSCSSISMPDKASTPPEPTNTFTVTLPLHSSVPTETYTPQLSSFEYLKYPNHENCTVQVDTQKWEITEEGSQYIASDSTTVLISKSQGIGYTYFVNHKYYTDCNLGWITAGYRGEGVEKSLETINNRVWEIWYPGRVFLLKVYSWPELREIQIVHDWPLNISQEESCQADIYEILGSIQCVL